MTPSTTTAAESRRYAVLRERVVHRSRDGVSVSEHVGTDAVTALAAELEGLARRSGAPMTAAPVWALVSCDVLLGGTPWALVARAVNGTALGAMVLLDRAVDRRTMITTLAGADGGHRAALLTGDADVARALGAALLRVLDSQVSATSVVLGPLPDGDPVVDAFAAGLDGSWCESIDGIPVIRGNRSDHTVVAADYLQAGMRRSLRKARNRLVADGLVAAIDVTRDGAAVLELVPLLVDVHRKRDHSNGRVSELDDPRRQRVWLRRLEQLARAGVLELARLHIDGTLAAYTLGAWDGAAYRLLEGRFVSEWARYSPGRLLEACVVERVLSAPGVLTFDWMTAVAPESLLGSNAVDPMVMIRLGRSRF